MYCLLCTYGILMCTDCRCTDGILTASGGLRVYGSVLFIGY